MALNITLTSLEALVLKATHESLSSPETAALEAFCAVMRNSNDGAQLAAQALASRIHSSNSQEALLALSMIDQCMRKGDTNFHAEIGKFRFLNEMIKLVSPKYLADRTTAEVKTRVLQLFHAWAIEYPKENKFKVAYDMLKNQGVIKETPPPLPSDHSVTIKQRPKSAIFEEAAKSKLLQRLLQSKNPEDLQNANKLIKLLVVQEEMCNEKNSRRSQAVNAALDRAGLLRDMLEKAQDASADEEQLIHELHATCAQLRRTFQHLATDITHSDALDTILHVSEVLDEVSEKYDKFIQYKRQKGKSTPIHTNGDTLLDLAGSTTQGAGDSSIGSRVADELGDIFIGNGTGSGMELLTPVNLGGNNEPNLTGESSKKKDEGWDVLNTLGEQMLKQSLPDTNKRMDNFTDKQAKKIPMNSLEKLSPNQETTKINESLLDLDFFTRKPEEQISKLVDVSSPKTSLGDVMMVDITDDQPSTSNTDKSLERILDLKITEEKCDKLVNKNNISSNELVSLDDINVSLENIRPGTTSPKIAMEKDGLIVTLHFCKDKPKAGVSVVVVSTISKKNVSIDDFVFHATVPKGYKVRLLPPSGSMLPPHNPFLPPPALTQIMLIHRRNTEAMRLNYVVIYTCEDQTFTEMGEIRELPVE